VPGAFPVAVISDQYGARTMVLIRRWWEDDPHQPARADDCGCGGAGVSWIDSRDVVRRMGAVHEQTVLNGVKEWMLRDRHDRNMLGIARLKPA